MLTVFYSCLGCMLAIDILLIVANYELKHLNKNKGETKDVD